MARVAKQPRLQSPARGAATLALPPISNFAPMARSARQPRMQSIAAPTFAIPAILNFASLAGRSAPIPVIQDTARGGLGTQRKTTTGQVTGRSSRNPTGDARPQNAVVAGQSPGYRGGYTLPAQPPGAPYDYWKERDYILQVNVGRKFSECSNEMITQIYGECSEHDHNLQALLSNRTKAEDLIDSWQMLPGKKHGCRSRKLYTPPLYTECHRCQKRVSYSPPAYRLVAIYKEADWNLWMAVVTTRGSQIKLFQASARCNIYQHQSHCVHIDHVFLETQSQNSWRAGNHTGTYGCFCPVECIGEHVRRGVLTHEEQKAIKTANFVFPMYPYS